MNVPIKRLILMLLLCGGCSVASWAQADARQEVFDAYRAQAGDGALLFYGKVASEYLPQQYDNHPYWESAEFQPGAICLNGLRYNDLLLRYDAYLHRLSVLAPQSRIAVYVDMDKVDYFVRRGVAFERRDNKFVARLYDSPQMKLVKQVSCSMGTSIVRDLISYKTFDRSVRHILILDGKEHMVSSRSSVLKLFPVHKKALKRFSKEQNLDFRSRRSESLQALVAEANRLIL